MHYENYQRWNILCNKCILILLSSPSPLLLSPFSFSLVIIASPSLPIQHLLQTHLNNPPCHTTNYNSRKRDGRLQLLQLIEMTFDFRHLRACVCARNDRCAQVLATHLDALIKLVHVSPQHGRVLHVFIDHLFLLLHLLC